MINSFLNKLPMIIALSLSMIIYFSIDKNNKITNKINSYINIDYKWRPCFFVCSTFLITFIVGILGIYIIHIPDLIYSVLSGIILGVGTSISVKTSQVSI